MTDLSYTRPMAGLTLSIEEDILHRARVRAVEEGASVSAVVREFLKDYAAVQGHEVALSSFLQSAAVSSAGSSGGRRNWTRDEIYVQRTPG